MTARVFAVQVPARREGASGPWVEKYDLGAAERFGELVRVLPYGNVPNDSGPTLLRLYDAFRDFRFDVDYVLLLGDPVAIALAVRVLTTMEPSRPVRLLKWDRRAGDYLPYIVG